jgi:hypothetical protein
MVEQQDCAHGLFRRAAAQVASLQRVRQELRLERGHKAFSSSSTCMDSAVAADAIAKQSLIHTVSLLIHLQDFGLLTLRALRAEI